MMKRNLIPFTAFLAALVFVACDGGKKQDHPRDVSVPSEQAVPKTPGEKILAVLLLIQDQATANAHAAEVKELAASLPGDIPNEEAVNIANELMRLASRECIWFFVSGRCFERNSFRYRGIHGQCASGCGWI